VQGVLETIRKRACAHRNTTGGARQDPSDFDCKVKVKVRGGPVRGRKLLHPTQR
jgi:hypothetical protein